MQAIQKSLLHRQEANAALGREGVLGLIRYPVVFLDWTKRVLAKCSMYNKHQTQLLLFLALTTRLPIKNLAPSIPFSMLRSLRFASDQSLNITDALLKDLLQDFRILQFLGDFGDDAVGELFLLTLFDLSFVADPAVEHGLGFCRERGALRELKCLGLEMGRFLERELI
jgi:hypothetical protein